MIEFKHKWVKLTFLERLKFSNWFKSEKLVKWTEPKKDMIVFEDTIVMHPETLNSLNRQLNGVNEFTW